MSPEIQIVAVSQKHGTDQVVRNIREWCLNSIDPFLAGKVKVIKKEANLYSAVDRIADNDRETKNILVSIGFDEADVLSHVNQLHKNGHNLEIIVRPPRPAIENDRDDSPSSSMLERGRIVIAKVQNTIPAIRKSLLRLALRDQVTISCLKTQDQLESYFVLRYKVWKEMGYLPQDRDCELTGLELDYTDEAAIPIGAFNKEGGLVGCARLVFARIAEIYDYPDYYAIINKLIDERGSTCLRKNFTRPAYLLHPFDILGAFGNFQRYYLRLVRLRIPKAEVSRVIIAQEYRRRGLGEVMVDSLLSIAHDQKIHVLFLACHEQHHKFYERCGFHALPGLWCKRFSNIDKPSIAMAYNLRKKSAPIVH